MAEPEKPLLDLSTLIERPEIDIDGERYELASPEELSVMDTQRVASLGRKLDKLMRQEGEAQSKVLNDTLEAIVAVVMAPIDKDIRDRLSDTQKLAVIDVFSMLSLARKTRLAGATIPQVVKMLQGVVPTNGQPTGEKSPPASSDSTGETR